MVAELKGKFGANNQAITCTITSLANNSLRQSAAVDNTANLFLNALVGVTVKTGAGGTSSTGYVNVYAYASVDGGTNYTGGASGADAVYTADKQNLKWIGNISVNANATVYRGTFDVASAFGNVLPASWGIVVENLTGATLDASVGAAVYQGSYAQSV